MTAQIKIKLCRMGDTAVHHGSGRNVITATTLKHSAYQRKDLFTFKKRVLLGYISLLFFLF